MAVIIKLPKKNKPTEPQPRPRIKIKHHENEHVKNPLFRKYLANVYENGKNSSSRFITALGAIFAKNETQALTQAQSIYTCKQGQRIELSECIDPFL
ncbi:VHS1087 protein [Vibrio phage 1]|nr:PH-108-4-96 [Vibrio phage 1]AEH21900.1 VHS1087 protein [Vibrio phage 1]